MFGAGGLDLGVSLSRTVFKRKYFPAIQRVTLEKLKGLFHSQTHPSLTADCWTDKKLRSYLAVTIHWVDPSSFESLHALLDLFPLEDRHTAEYLTKSIETAVNAIADDTVTIHCATGDGTANSALSLRHYVGTENFIWCYAHRLNLIVQHSLERISPRIEEVRALCRTLRNSPSLRRKLVTIAGLEPSLDCMTRWNSTHDMLQRFLDLLPQLTCLIRSDDDFKDLAIPPWVASSLKSVIAILKPFKEVSMLSQSCSFPTLYCVPLWTRYLNLELGRLAEQLETPSSIPAILCHSLQEQLRYYLTNPTIEGNNVLKPQSIYIKALFFCCRIDWMSETELAVTRGLLIPIFKEMKPDPFLVPLKQIMSDDVVISSLFIALQKAIPPSYPHISHLKDFEEITCTSPADWWRVIGSKSFALLAPMARMLLAIPATSAPSESTFSRASFDDRDNRSRLGAQTLRMSLLVSRNAHLFNPKELLTAVTRAACSLKRTARPVDLDDSPSSDDEDVALGLESDVDSSHSQS